MWTFGRGGTPAGDFFLEHPFGLPETGGQELQSAGTFYNGQKAVKNCDSSLDPAALARSLRLPPSALRIIDLSALEPGCRDEEARRLAEAAGLAELPPRLRVRVDALAEGVAGVDWLVFAPEAPGRKPEKVYDSPLDYWTDRAPELPASPDLPVVSPGPPGPARRRLSELDAETWAELRARTIQSGLAPASLLLASLADVLAAWSEEPRFTVDLSIAGAPAGLWVPLELDGAAPGPFEERAFALQDRLRRDLSYPLTRTVRPDGFAPSSVAVALPPRLFGQDTEEPDDSASRRPARGREPARLLRLQAAEREGGLLLLWDVAEASFPEGMADALTGALRDLLRRLAAGPALKEVRRRLIPPQQLARMVAFNTTGSPLPEPFVWELFAARARKDPDRPAVLGLATYGELLRDAERIGHLLQREGARRNAPVAVALEPGRERAAALLGVLAAGAPYLPLDPDLPRAEFRALLEHGRAGLAVTREGLAGALDWPEEIVGIMVEDLGAADLPAGPPTVPSASPKDLACILSGVMLENRGVANLVEDVVRRFGLGPADRTLALAPLSEGASLVEIFATLAAGGAVVLPDGGDLARQIRRDGVTVLAGPAETVESLLAAGAWLPRVLLVAGGEPAPDLAERVRKARPGARIGWLRGSLETSVWTSIDEDGSGFGRPLSNQSVHVLDGRMELRPFWVPGDLYLGGIGLARGYWRDPARSGERFAVHPDTGERLFRTGERARWLPGGEIEVI